MEFEKYDSETGQGYSWIERLSLQQLLEQRDHIIEFAEQRKRREKRENRTWQEKMIEGKADEDPENQACIICSL
jgi:hypothetical protein